MSGKCELRQTRGGLNEIFHSIILKFKNLGRNKQGYLDPLTQFLLSL